MKDASETTTNKGFFSSVKNIIVALFFITGLIFHISLLFRINDPAMQGWYFDAVNAPDPGMGVDFNALYVQSRNLVTGKSIYPTVNDLLGKDVPDPVQYDAQADYTGPPIAAGKAKDHSAVQVSADRGAGGCAVDFFRFRHGIYHMDHLP